MNSADSGVPCRLTPRSLVTVSEEAPSVNPSSATWDLVVLGLRDSYGLSLSITCLMFLHLVPAFCFLVALVPA